MSEQPQEWTPEYLHSIGIFTTEQMCDAHNAALAAAVDDHASVLLAIHEAELAAEREKRKTLVDALEQLRCYCDVTGGHHKQPKRKQKHALAKEGK